MKKKFWLILYHLGGSVLAASIIEAKFERKFLRENPEIKKDTTYRIAKTLEYLCGLILVVGVWPRH